MTCTATNCQVVFRLCATSQCPGAVAVPSGTTFTVSLRNGGGTNDSIQKATGSGYTILSSNGPGNGATATLNAGSTWTYNARTSQSIPVGSCIQFAFNNVNPNTSYTLSASSQADGIAANSTNCSRTVTTGTTPGNSLLC